ncbi:hypothetical protein RHODGE_RHODGE_02196 [Rhodoplanes serenus]|uniref:DUF2029 domain-containing protein n=3 Tax=Rhodoplanes TaxID=29407 RepID=A0A3S4BWC2_9BRAD|nr:hypothetical protein RHODGE_RHODGE_02196 [Rhodoplanes serenus]
MADMGACEGVAAVPSAVSRRTVHLAVLVALFGLVLAATALRFALEPPGPAARSPVDFDAFRLAGDLVRQGRITLAYRFSEFQGLLRAEFGGTPFLPWTYPPPFDLVVAPLALLPAWLGYAVFMGGTLWGFLAALRRLAPDGAVPALILFTPVVLVTLRCGQNGLLTGALIAWACCGLLAGRAWAGVPLGLMVIKPHLAMAFAAYVVLSGRWSVAATAAATALSVSLAATVVLGPDVWIALAGSIREAKTFLADGYYPLFRMVSPYAALHTLGAGPTVAMAGQVAVALLALAVVAWASRRLPVRHALGVTAVASLLISPYAYDYDLTIVAVGLALLLPDLIRCARSGERGAVYALCVVAGGFGLAQSAVLSARFGPVPELVPGDMPLSLSGFCLVALLGLLVGILARARRAEPALTVR